MLDTEHQFPIETQKLVAYGKVMEDNEKTLADYKVVEGGFLVIMTMKVSYTALILEIIHSESCKGHSIDLRT